MCDKTKTAARGTKGIEQVKGFLSSIFLLWVTHTPLDRGNLQSCIFSNNTNTQYYKCTPFLSSFTCTLAVILIFFLFFKVTVHFTLQFNKFLIKKMTQKIKETVPVVSFTRVAPVTHSSVS